MRSLLDVNVIIALLDPDHVFHERAHAWWADHDDAGWASCPITEPLEVAETRAAVRADVFGAEGHPQMLLRIGWAPVNADPLPSTPRRALSDYVSDLDNASGLGDTSDLDDTTTA